MEFNLLDCRKYTCKLHLQLIFPILSQYLLTCKWFRINLCHQTRKCQPKIIVLINIQNNNSFSTCISFDTFPNRGTTLKYCRLSVKCHSKQSVIVSEKSVTVISPSCRKVISISSNTILTSPIFRYNHIKLITYYLTLPLILGLCNYIRVWRQGINFIAKYGIIQSVQIMCDWSVKCE